MEKPHLAPRHSREAQAARRSRAPINEPLRRTIDRERCEGFALGRTIESAVNISAVDSRIAGQKCELAKVRIIRIQYLDWSRGHEWQRHNIARFAPRIQLLS